MQYIHRQSTLTKIIFLDDIKEGNGTLNPRSMGRKAFHNVDILEKTY